MRCNKVRIYRKDCTGEIFYKLLKGRKLQVTIKNGKIRSQDSKENIDNAIAEVSIWMEKTKCQKKISHSI